MSSARKLRIEPLQQTPSKGKEMPPAGGIRWRGWVVVLGALCLLGASGHAYSADPDPGFNFDDFTKNKPFTLNTMDTTPYGPPWRDVLLKPENFLHCSGAKIALCYYSGPEYSQTGGAATPCDASDPAIANCTCYVISDRRPYLVDINAILNLDVYLDTVKKCGSDGSQCQPYGPHSAPVCDSINAGTFIPGAELISTFSLALAGPLDGHIPLGNTACYQSPVLPEPRYAGCMTAPCKILRNPITGLPVKDPYTDLDLAQCACPIAQGSFQVGQDGQTCNIGPKNVWSAAFTPKEVLSPLIPPPPPPPHHCWPDSPTDDGCPLLPRGFLPSVPSRVSCQEVCSEYKQSNHNGIQVGFTCDATLCTADSDPALVINACDGLAKHSVSEILKLEVAVGYSCSASQICGCKPNKKTNQEIWRLNEAQKNSNPTIETQCVYNETLCGTKP